MNKFFKAALRKEASAVGTARRARRAMRSGGSVMANNARKSTKLAQKLSNKPGTVGMAGKVWNGTKSFVKKHPVWTGVGAMAVPHAISGIGNMFGGGNRNYNYRGMDPMQMMMMMSMMRNSGGSSMFGGLPFSMPNFDRSSYAYQVPEAFRHTYF